MPRTPKSSSIRDSRPGQPERTCVLLSRLLSGRNEPSILEKECVLKKLLTDKRRQTTEDRWWKVPAVAPALATVAVFALLLAPQVLTGMSTAEFVARGFGRGSLQMMCLDPLSDTRTECTPGSVLALAPSPPVDLPYFAAFALRNDGVLLWYFPEEEHLNSELLAEYGGPVDRGIALELEEHPPGTYELVAVFSDRPLDREALRAALGPELDGRDGLHLIRRTFEVVPQMEDR